MRPVWDDGRWTPLPPLAGDVEADVCVVGLGGSGLSAIDELRARGASVVGIDAGPVGGGAAGRNGGFLLAGLAPPYHRVRALLGPLAADLYRATQAEMRRFGTARFPGSLRIEDTEEGLADCAAQAAALRADGFAVEEFDGPEGRGLLLPDDGVFQPLARCRSLAVDLLTRGARLHEGSPAVSIGPGRVTTPAGAVSCAAVLVFVDGHLDRLLPELAGVVRTVRLQMLATGPAPEVSVPRPVYLRGGYEYWQQLPDGRIALGGFRDVGGAAEQTHDATPTRPVQDALERHLRERLGVTAAVTHRWAASVGYTASGLPYAGEVRPGVWAAGGYCGTGNVVGALCGRELAAVALGGSAPASGFLAASTAVST
jgi:glycine/D-amino acid oxidase-like deaminating enzyme